MDQLSDISAFNVRTISQHRYISNQRRVSNTITITLVHVLREVGIPCANATCQLKPQTPWITSPLPIYQKWVDVTLIILKSRSEKCKCPQLIYNAGFWMWQMLNQPIQTLCYNTTAQSVPISKEKHGAYERRTQQTTAQSKTSQNLIPCVQSRKRHLT